MKLTWGAEVQLHPFLTSPPDGGEVWTSSTLGEMINSETVKEKYHFGGPDVEKITLLKWVLQLMHELGSSGSGRGKKKHFCNIYIKKTYFPAHKTHRDFFVRNFRKKNNGECILILVIYWKKTGLLHTKISSHNIVVTDTKIIFMVVSTRCEYGYL